MGCDGGTIPRRDELVKTKQKPEQKDKDAERLYRWKHCAVSQSPLQHPIVACELGRLYSKEEVISRLLSKAKEPAMAHIKGIKDIKELILTRNPSYRDDTPKGDDYIDSHGSEFICPITSQEMNGKSKFYFIWTCGCVLSERALKEIKSDRCHICNRNFIQTDVIALNSSDEETEELELRMEERREKRKLEKKNKKREEDSSRQENDKIKKKRVDEPSSSSQANGASRSQSGCAVSSYASSLLRDKEFQKVRSAEYSVASDKSKSEIYKSLFDTHKTAQNKKTSHWVTCNPQYF